MHLVGFIIGIYHSAWSPERQILIISFCNPKILILFGQCPQNNKPKVITEWKQEK